MSKKWIIITILVLVLTLTVALAGCKSNDDHNTATVGEGEETLSDTSVEPSNEAEFDIALYLAENEDKLAQFNNDEKKLTDTEKVRENYLNPGFLFVRDDLVKFSLKPLPSLLSLPYEYPAFIDELGFEYESVSNEQWITIDVMIQQIKEGVPLWEQPLPKSGWHRDFSIQLAEHDIDKVIEIIELLQARDEVYRATEVFDSPAIDVMQYDSIVPDNIEIPEGTMSQAGENVPFEYQDHWYVWVDGKLYMLVEELEELPLE